MTLWCVNIQGPDDVVPVASYNEAAAVANEFNRWRADMVALEGGLHEYDARVWAVPMEWHSTPESHAHGLRNPSSDYAPFVQAVAKRIADPALRPGDEIGDMVVVPKVATKAQEEAGYDVLIEEWPDDWHLGPPEGITSEMYTARIVYPAMIAAAKEDNDR